MFPFGNPAILQSVYDCVMRRRLVKASALLVACLAIAGAARVRVSCADRFLTSTASCRCAGRRRPSTSFVTPTPFRIFSRRPCPTRCSAWDIVHAQDRLWQMEFQRRIGHGRLSEIFGAATVAQDRFLRTVGFGRAARSAWEQMPEWAKARVNAYVAGVNAFIETHQGAKLPPEFTLLRFAPEPWSGVDVVVWVKMMAWDLSANYSFELLRDDLVRAVGVERMQQLMPAAAEDGLSIVPSTKTFTTKDTSDTEANDARPRRISSSVSSVSSVVESSPAVAPLRSSPPCPVAYPRFATFCSAAPRPNRSARTTGSSTARSPPPASRCSPTTRISGRSFRPPGTSRTCRPATST